MGVIKSMNPATDFFCKFVFERLEQIPGFRSRRMFGGVGLYAGAKFFGLIAAGRLYFRANEETRVDYVAAGMGYFQPTPEQAIKNYYEVPADILEDSDRLVAWAEGAVRITPAK